MVGPSKEKRNPHAMLALICAAAFIVYLDTSITPVAVPAIRAEFAAGVTAGQWLLDSYTLAFACLLLTAGSLGDRFGRKTVLIAGSAGFALCSVACAAAPSATVLIAARAGQGAFAAAVVPLSLAVTSEVFTDPKAKARAIGIWGGIAGIAVALGPLLGGLLVELAGWRSMFWINLPIGLVAVLGLVRLLPASARGKAGRVDVPGQTLFIVASAALTFALIEGVHLGWTSPVILGLLGLSAVSFLAFGIWESRCPEPLLPPRLLRIPAAVVACVVNFLGLFGLYAVLYLVTVHLQETLGLPPLATGLRFLALTGFLGATAFFASAIAARLGNRRTMISGLVCIAVGLAGLTLLESGGGYATYGWAFVLIGVGIPLSSGVVAIQAMIGAVPPDLTGTASGTMNTFRQFGAVFGVALAGILSPQLGNAVTSMHVTFLFASAGALAGAVVTAIVLREKRSSEPAAEARPVGAGRS